MSQPPGRHFNTSRLLLNTIAVAIVIVFGFGTLLRGANLTHEESYVRIGSRVAVAIVLWSMGRVTVSASGSCG
jgi:hypothetical protein